MEELKEYSPQAHDQLLAIHADEELVHALGQSLRNLTHNDLYTTSGGDIITNPRHEHIPPTEFDDAQQEQHSRVNDLLADVARLTSQAVSEMSSSGSESTEGDASPTEQNVFRYAKQIALQQALEAHETGDSEAKDRSMDSLIVLGLLEKIPGSNTYTGSDREVVLKAVEAGLANDLLSAIGRLDGIVAISSDGESAVSAPSLYADISDLIRVATNRDFDDQFQHQQELVRPDMPEEDIKRKNEILERLDPIELNSLAKQSANKDYSAYLSLKALSKVPSMESIRITADTPDLLADVIRTSIIHAEATNDTQIKKQCQLELEKIRATRDAGNLYRINSNLPYILDKTIIALARDGDMASVYALMSSSPRELKPEGESENIGKSYNLDHALKYQDYEQDSLSPEDQSRIRQILVNVYNAKLQHLKDTLSNSGLDVSQIESILTNSADPDSALGVPVEFWQIDDLSNLEREMFFGSPGRITSNFEKTAKSILRMRNAGITHENISENLIRLLDKHQIDEAHYLQSLGQVITKLQEGSHSELTYHQEQQVLEMLAEFDDPIIALELVELMSGTNSYYLTVSKLIRILSHDNYRDISSDPIPIPEELLENFKNAIHSTDLQQILVKNRLEQEIHEDILGKILSSEDMEGAAQRIANIFKGGVVYGIQPLSLQSYRLNQISIVKVRQFLQSQQLFPLDQPQVTTPIQSNILTEKIWLNNSKKSGVLINR